jgi:hypothetical protein
MANTLTQVGIETGNAVEAYHVTQSIDAFTGAVAYDITLSGSFNMTGPINGQSGLINPLTASYAISSSRAISASFVTSASYALSSSRAVSASFVTSASYAVSASFVTSASYALSSSYAATASYTITSSYAQTAQTASYVTDLRLFTSVSGNVSGVELSRTLLPARDQIALVNFTATTNNGTGQIQLPSSATTRQIGDKIEIIFNSVSPSYTITHKVDISGNDQIQVWDQISTTGGYITVGGNDEYARITLVYIDTDLWSVTSYSDAITIYGTNNSGPGDVIGIF